MTKTELEAKIEALQAALNTKAQEQNAYQDQINDLQKQLKDINKPKLTDIQFDELHKAIEEGIGNFDFSDTDMYSFDYGINYDGRVYCESFDFDCADDLVHEIYEQVARLFGEADENNNQENQD